MPRKNPKTWKLCQIYEINLGRRVLSSSVVFFGRHGRCKRMTLSETDTGNGELRRLRELFSPLPSIRPRFDDPPSRRSKGSSNFRCLSLTSAPPASSVTRPSLTSTKQTCMCPKRQEAATSLLNTIVATFYSIPRLNSSPFNECEVTCCAIIKKNQECSCTGEQGC